MTRPVLPNRMFAAGHEPVGVRVTAYHKPRGIAAVINALEEDEITYLRQSPFGKFISIAEKPCFSGRFARFVISRQLKVNKKHEIWILFASNPVRVSLREFAIVTGLPCGDYPQKSKKKLRSRISENSNWASLFGTLKHVSVKSVIRMLKNKTVTDRDTRLKYACLALLDSVLLPTTHRHKIDPDHAEAIRDLDQFFSYPWGRLSFDMMMSSIKERNEVSLSQNTVAIKGFIHALQLVLVAAIPALTDDALTVQSFSSSDSDSEEDSGDEKPAFRIPKVTLNPAHARTLNGQKKVAVASIIPADDENMIDESVLGWKDELCDTRVDTLVSLIKSQHNFSDNLFTGGCTKSDVNRMRTAAKDEKDRVKSLKGKSVIGLEDYAMTNDNGNSVPPSSNISLGTCSTNFGENSPEETINCRLDNMHKTVMEMQGFLASMKNTLICEIRGKVSELGDSIIDRVVERLESGKKRTCEANKEQTPHDAHYKKPKETCGCFNKPPPCLHSHQTPNEVEGSVGFHCSGTPTFCFTNGVTEVAFKTNAMIPVVCCPPPSFSLGLSEDSDDGASSSQGGIDVNGKYCVREITEVCTFNPCHVEEANVCKKAKLLPYKDYGGRIPNKLMAVDQSGSHVGSQMQPPGDFASKFQILEGRLSKDFFLTVGSLYLTSQELNDIVYRKTHLKVHTMDVLMEHTRLLFNKRGSGLPRNGIQIQDTGFVSLVMRSYSGFKNEYEKGSHRFPDYLIRQLHNASPISLEPKRIYFPFNFDRQHWVGVCVDVQKGAIYVLDCHITFCSDWQLKQKLQPLALMFPILIQQAYCKSGDVSLNPFTIQRLHMIPQNRDVYQSGVTSVLLLQAHAIAGPTVCFQFTPDVVDLEAKRLAVSLYEMSSEELL